METKGKVKKLLADFLGVDPEDIDDEAFLAEDLHLDPTSLTDFMEILKNEGFDTSKANLEEIETFSELVENLSLK
ncbi:MAG: acyl carrier protein [Microgenomates group bacterium]